MNKDKRYVNLVFEHLDCDLYKYIKDQRFPNDSLLIKVSFFSPKFLFSKVVFSSFWINDLYFFGFLKSFMYQILSALAHCHSHKVIHRDVKTKNLLIDESSMMIKLADFGLAREFADPDMLYTEMVNIFLFINYLILSKTVFAIKIIKP